MENQEVALTPQQNIIVNTSKFFYEEVERNQEAIQGAEDVVRLMAHTAAMVFFDGLTHYTNHLLESGMPDEEIKIKIRDYITYCFESVDVQLNEFMVAEKAMLEQDEEPEQG